MATGHIFIILIPIFFVILIGYFAGLFKAFNPASSKGLNTLVTKFALPAHLFIGITTTPRETLIQKWPFSCGFATWCNRLLYCIAHCLSLNCQKRPD